MHFSIEKTEVPLSEPNKNEEKPRPSSSVFIITLENVKLGGKQ